MCLFKKALNIVRRSQRKLKSLMQSIGENFVRQEVFVMKKDNKNTIEELFSLIARQNEVVKRVKNGGLSMSDALSLTQKMLDGEFPKDNFQQFIHLLRPISQQAVELRRLNSEMPEDMRVPDSWFDDLNTDSDHIQKIEDLEILFISPKKIGTFKSMRAIIEYQIKLVELTQYSVWSSPDFNKIIDHCWPDESANKSILINPGIHRLRINLVSYWNPKSTNRKISADLMRKQPSINVLLAGVAAIGAYAVQDPDLYRSQDGINLPCFYLADLKSGAMKSDSDFLYSVWNYNKCTVEFDFQESTANLIGPEDIYQVFAKPSFVNG